MVHHCFNRKTVGKFRHLIGMTYYQCGDRHHGLREIKDFNDPVGVVNGCTQIASPQAEFLSGKATILCHQQGIMASRHKGQKIVKAGIGFPQAHQVLNLLKSAQKVSTHRCLLYHILPEVYLHNFPLKEFFSSDYNTVYLHIASC